MTTQYTDVLGGGDGELVQQDPNDEPASVLLERIRDRRAAAPKAKRGRRSAVSAYA